MPALLLENFSEKVYRSLEESASAHHRSTAEEAIALLQQALTGCTPEPHPDLAIIEEMSKHRWVPPPGSPECWELIREDRDR